MSEIPDELRYSSDHLWVRRRADSTTATRVGITDFAQQALGDVVAVTLPRIGDSLTSGSAYGDIESTKSVSDIIAPIRGSVARVNPALVDAPELLNSEPYDGGWLFEVEPRHNFDVLQP